MNIQKLIDIKNTLNQNFFEREKEIEGLLIALLSRQHVLLLGPPGVGKSQLSRAFTEVLDGSNYFEWCLSQFTSPEELFGSIIFEEFEKGIYKRNTANKMPEAHIAFVDEIYKANSAVLNTLLPLINERVFHNGDMVQKSPLVTVVGASNEFAEEDNLAALSDRFVLRYDVERIKEPQNFVKMLEGSTKVAVPKMTLAELADYQFFADLTVIPQNIYHQLVAIRTALADEGVFPSDRRIKQCLSVLKAKAFLDGRGEVVVDDLKILKNALWEELSHREITEKIVEKFSHDPLTQKLNDILNDFNELKKLAESNYSLEESLEIVKKIKLLLAELEQLRKSNQGTSKIENLIADIKAFSEKFSKKAVGF